MQRHGTPHGFTKHRLEQADRASFVMVVNASRSRVFTQCVGEVANVVKEGGGDESERCAGLFGELGGLQGVL